MFLFALFRIPYAWADAKGAWQQKCSQSVSMACCHQENVKVLMTATHMRNDTEINLVSLTFFVSIVYLYNKKNKQNKNI